MADSKNAGEILQAVVEDGRQELDRASLGLTFSGFAAGLNISFSAVALAVVGVLTGGGARRLIRCSSSIEGGRRARMGGGAPSTHPLTVP